MHILCSLVSLIAAVCVAASNQKPLPPTQDPFYTAPPRYKTATPGTVLRMRVAPGNLPGTYFPSASAVYNVVYATTDSRYRPSWALTTYFVPKTNHTTSNSSTRHGSSTSGALLSYQIPYDSASLDSVPSYGFYAPPAPIGTVNQDISSGLTRGWHVNVPDYEGPLSSFGLGIQAGHATLDSIRAARAIALGLNDDAPTAMWGYSGGSIASEWAAELAAAYAPELRFAGTAIGGLVVNVTSSLDELSGTRWAGLMPNMLLGVTSQSPPARAYLLEQLEAASPSDRALFLSAHNITIERSFDVFNNTDIWSFFTAGRAILTSPLMKPIMDEQTVMGYHGIPQMPIFAYKAVQDELAPIYETSALVERYCRVGVEVLYEKNTIGGHLAEEFNSDARALEWLSGVLGYDSSNATHGGCVVREVALNVTDSPL